MAERKFITDPFVLAVIFNEYDAVKNILDSGNYNEDVFLDISMKNYFGLPIPVQYISRCWEICLNPEQQFREPFNQTVIKHYENAKKILDLLKEQKGVEVGEIPFSKIYGATWAWEDDTDEEVLDGKKSDFIAHGIREINLDLFIAVQKMEFDKAKSLLEKGANPMYEHPGYDDLLAICGCECTYQVTCQAGELIKSPGWVRNSINKDEIANIFRWAANEKMYELLESYLPQK